jgi:hypothetical protein
MSKIVQRTYSAINNRHKIYRAVFGKWLTKEEISEITGIGTPSSVRSMCDHLILNGYVKKVDSYNKVIKRWAVKYSAVIEKPFVYKSYEQLLEEYYKAKDAGNFHKEKGIYDDLIAKNPNLRVIRQTDTKVQDSWRKKPTSYYRGIASTLNTGD